VRPWNALARLNERGQLGEGHLPAGFVLIGGRPGGAWSCTVSSSVPPLTSLSVSLIVIFPHLHAIVVPLVEFGADRTTILNATA
jgi:hypothetical protein